MAGLNLIFWKKFLFTGGILGLTITPTALLIGRNFSGEGSGEISRYKKNALIQGYAKQFGIGELSKEVFGIVEMREDINDVVGEDLSYLAVSGSGRFRDEFKEMWEQEEKDYLKDYSSFKESNKYAPKFFDSRGGNREDMRRRNLTSKTHELFKKEILAFGLDNFTLNNNTNTKHRVSRNSHISKDLIDNNKQNIGFYSREDNYQAGDIEFEREKYGLINFAHKRWFKDVKPFYVWMSLWKHSESSKDYEIEEWWDKSKAKDTLKPSYRFPFYGEKTTKKFKDFYENVVKQYENNKVYIPKGYTEDSGTTILVEGRNMYTQLYSRFAAAANYKYQQKIKGNSSGEKINQREKSEDVSSYKQPTELFMFDANHNGGTKARVEVNKELFKDANKQNKNHIGDLVEVKDTPWMFIRNEAGIHAMAVDIENSTETQLDENKAYEHFQYRTLQAKYKNLLSLTGTIDINPENVVKNFKDYFDKNFNRILVEYAYSKNDNKFFNQYLPYFITQYKDVFNKGIELWEIKDRYLARLKLRETVIKTYALDEWETDSSNNKFKNPKNDHGLAGMIPWNLKTELASNNGDSYVFEQLEKIYDKNGQTNNKDILTQYKETLKEYQDKGKELTDKLNLKITNGSLDVRTDRIFSSNYYINRIQDKFLDSSNTFDEFLFKYIIKNDYLGKSKLGNKGFVSRDDLEVTVPDNLKSTASGSDIIKDMNDDTSIKEVLGKIDSKIQAHYYSKLMLDENSHNPWASAKYGGELLAQDKDNLAQVIQSVAKNSFHHHLTMGIGDFRDKYYKFLSTLSYLIEDNFKNLLKYLSTHISYDKDSYIFFINNDLDKKSVKLSDKSLNNPFLNRAFYADSTFTKEAHDIYRYFKSKNFKDAKSKVPEGMMYGGFYNGNNVEKMDIPEGYADFFKSSSLYRYGADAQSMDKYVLGITSEDQYKNVVEQIKKTITSSGNEWISNLSLQTIYVKDGANKTIKTLTLQERKNLLSAYLNKVDVQINQGSIEKSKYKNAFLSDPNNNYNLADNSKHIPGSKEKIKTDNFKKAEDIKRINDNTKTAFKLFQMNVDDVSNFDKFKTYVNSNLSEDVFWSWVINMASVTEVQDLARQDLSSRVDKVEVFDAKWHDKGNSAFVK